ncbi:hypothetical protein CSTERTH_06020 [Thermoclostridium stercorarium subsp. thermolacticum DSM 2910]|uniref:Uncharacterized protein n=2 Tax=Thermoclostridium stercorarium TaxID=1510 RepID=A0A1B1YCY5_THEST|nr:hypothetical protein CSTERTH_06020 [Thermoclostridium stercorarium subsp. thermolacticum DSM 2910]
MKKMEKMRGILKNKTGNTIPTVLMVMLVVMLVGGAVAYSTVRLFNIVRSEEHNQMAYIAAESALERTISNLDQYLPSEDFAAKRGIVFTGEEQFINDIIERLNAGDSEVINSYSIPVYADPSMNEASVRVSYSWYGGEFERIGNKLKFPLEITAEAQMENGMFRSYGRKVVAVKEYEVWLYKPFVLNGAVYTLGDLVAKGDGVSTINGDVYVFGTGLDKPNRMEQYYMGGICAVENAILHIQKGSAFTNNLLRVGTFDETAGQQCAIVVDYDVVAEGIQAFGYDDSIVIIRDAYTFDDIEMNGANSYIAINGNYFGLSYGDGYFHDTSSAVLNIAPMYSGGFNNDFIRSRIVINGYAFVNGSTFVMEVERGRTMYQLEDVALAWRGNRPVYLSGGFDNTAEYIEDLKKNGGNGFSVILGDVGWTQNRNLTANWETWTNWIQEIRSRVTPWSNNIHVPSKITGLCHKAIAANNRIYFAGNDIEIPASVVCRIGDTVEGLEPGLLNRFIHYDWDEYSDMFSGMPKGLEILMSYLKGQVQVFARKDYPASQDSEVSYKFTPGMHEPWNLGATTEFLRIRDALDEIDANRWESVIKFEGGNNEPVDLVQYIEDNYSDTSKYYLIINLNPEKELIISRDTVNGIIFTMGKVTVENGATLNGAIIAAGRGYDPRNKVGGSAAEFDSYGNPRLPRIVGNTNVENFRNWDYAAVVLNSGNVIFPGREELFDRFTEEVDGIKFSDILRGIL